jgi:hypothetical protein
MYEETERIGRASEHENSSRKDKHEEAKLRKEKKLKELRQRQKKIISEQHFEEGGNSSSQEAVHCIVCKAGEEHEPLHFLSQVRHSNILTKSILKVN